MKNDVDQKMDLIEYDLRAFVWLPHTAYLQ